MGDEVNVEKVGKEEKVSKTIPRSLRLWIETLLSPLSFMTALTIIGLFSDVKLEGQGGEAIFFCLAATVGLALFKMARISLWILIVPVLLAMASSLTSLSFNRELVGNMKYLILYSGIGYISISVALGHWLATKYDKKATFIAAGISVAYVILGNIAIAINWQEVRFFMFMVIFIVVLFEAVTLGIYWEVNKNAPKSVKYGVYAVAAISVFLYIFGNPFCYLLGWCL